MKLSQVDVENLEFNAEALLASGISPDQLADIAITTIDHELSKFGMLFGVEALQDLLQGFERSLEECREYFDSIHDALLANLRLRKDLAEL